MSTFARNLRHVCGALLRRLGAIFVIVIVTFLGGGPVMSYAQDPVDTNLWLEDVEGAEAIAWVKKQNALAAAELQSSPEFAAIYPALLKILNASDRIPAVTMHGNRLYNFWQDPAHKRGIWRRTTETEFRKPEPAWETVLDLDALNARENAVWVWKGAVCYEPGAVRCLVKLSRGGGDAIVVREFDTATRQFVEGGFTLPEAKSDVAWHSRDAIYVATDFGAGTMTSSGYPRIVRQWRRGTPLSAATTVFEAQATDIAADVSVSKGWGQRSEIFVRIVALHDTEQFLRRGGRLIKLHVPKDAEIDIFRDRLLISLRSEWAIGGQRYPQGALLATSLTAMLDESGHARKFDIVFAPKPRVSLSGFAILKDGLVLSLLDNVRGRVVEMRSVRGIWQRREVPTEGFVTVSIAPIAPMHAGNDYFATLSGFLVPPSLYQSTAGSDRRELLKAQPERFDARGLAVQQHEAISSDGTRIPYFVIGRNALRLDGTNPTLLYGYGGFEISQVPRYSATFGAAWVERGGTWVVANIRGGGEFGPAWHQAALKEKRQHAFDDFIAVAEDLIARKVTTPAHLGIMGGSNGGLLVGVAMTQRPELFKAVVCGAPLLDMKRYSKLLAGASWMGEYGDPDVPAEWSYLSRYSPYQNVRPDVHYPRVLFTTSTRDDRVHPGHARKMAARMLEQGHRLLYYENIEGGHAGAADIEQVARISAMEMSFLWREVR